MVLTGAPVVPQWLVYHVTPSDHLYHPPQSGTATLSSGIKQTELSSEQVIIETCWDLCSALAECNILVII